MLKKKTNKKLKKLQKRLKMRRLQWIMSAIRTHAKLTQDKKDQEKNVKEKISSPFPKHTVKRRIKILKGRIASSRKRARDLWTK